MSTTALSPQKKFEISDIIKNKSISRETTKETNTTEDSRFATIEENPYFKIVFSKEVALEDKSKLIEKEWETISTVKELDTKDKELSVFKEYLQYKRKEMNQKLIQLNNTDAFSQLNKMFNDLNNGLIDFEDKMSPLTQLVDDFFQLRMSGEDAAYNLFKEIKLDEDKEKLFNAEKSNITNQVDEISKRISILNNDNLSLRNDTNWFGNITKDSMNKIGINNTEINNLNQQLTELNNKINVMTPPVAEQGDNYEVKQRIRQNLLALNSEEHIKRQQELIKAADNFINTSSDRVGELRMTFDNIQKHQSGLSLTNNNMIKTYAIINEGVKNAMDKNKTKFETLGANAEETSILKKMEAEQKKELVGRVIKKLEDSYVDSEENYADLSTQSIRIKNMEEATGQQMGNLRRLHSQGIAGVADRLNTVLSAVFSAAGSEAGAMADNTVRRMQNYTDDISMKESIRIASGMGEQNRRISEMLEKVSEYKQVNDHRNEMAKGFLQESRDYLSKMSGLVDETLKSVSASYNENATLNSEKKKEKEKVVEKNDPLASI